MGTSYRTAPGFFAALGGAVAGYVAGIVLAFALLWPFALVSFTALALGTPDAYHGLGALVLAALTAAVVQMSTTAWITQHAASILGDAPVRFRRALGAVFLGYVTNLLVGPAAAGVVAPPILGGAWAGLLVVALVVSSGRAAPLAPAA